MMEKRKIVIICSVVGFLGLLSAVMGFAAEGTKIKLNQVKQDANGVCIYPRSPAFALGFTSAMALLIAHIVINGFTGCICCRSPHPSSAHWRLAIVCFIVSWFTFVLSFLLLLAAAALNDQHSAESVYFGYYYCYVVKPGVFTGASILSLLSVVLGLLCYVALTNGKHNGSWTGPPPPHQSNIAMGQPQVPPVSHDPVFVHEDTYNRRQYA